MVPCQKRFKYTLDLHVHFFESEGDLDRLLGLANASYRELDGDWVVSIDLTSSDQATHACSAELRNRDKAGVYTQRPF